MSRANPQATIVSEEQLVPHANKLVIKKNNQRVASDSDITDTMLRFVMPSPNTKTPYIQHPTENEILGFIKTLSYDEDPKAKMTSLSTFVATRLRTYKFEMEIPDTTIDDAFKKSAGYKYYKAKKVESEKAKAAEKLEEQNMSPVRSGKGKGYMRSGDNEANVPKMFKKNVVPRKTRYFTVSCDNRLYFQG
ncbi:hypothetical protein Tco_0996631 [Tanacetum coccineum]